MKRLVQGPLRRWKAAHRRKPLIIRGGRQVGKTWSIEQLGRDEFKATIKVDLEKRADLHPLFGENLDSKTLLPRLEIAVGRRIVPGETLLFFDEIQACPRALMALRYLYEGMPELHVVAAGSLLEFVRGEISFPVGRVQFLDMYPLTFAEFVLAGGNVPLYEILRGPPAALDEVTHRLLLEHLRTYFFVGGMPEAVSAYLADGSILAAFEVQSEIIEAYRQDFSKYAPRADKDCLNQVLASCAASVGEQVKYSRLAQGFSNPTIRKAFDLLCMAEVLHKIPATKTPALPVGSNVNSKRFKASIIDIGLMQRISHLPVNVELRQQDLLAIYRGKLAEQYAAQELLISQKRELYYWAREDHSSSAEVDYLAQKDGRVCPVEVKSGAGGTLRSMHMLLEAHPEIPEGIVLCGGPYGRRPESRLCFVPLYFAGSVCSTPASTPPTLSRASRAMLGAPAGLQAVITRESAKRLAALSGSERTLKPVPRRRRRLIK
ncbi:MAG: ATP-binding protein [Steroidobacteraceae bacterium]